MPIKPRMNRFVFVIVVPLQPIRVNPDPNTQIYEKDVILDDDYDFVEKPSKKHDFVDKRSKTGEKIEREELSEDDM